VALSKTSTPSRRAAVYRLYDAEGTLLYIGSAYDPEGRCKGHHEKPWWPEVVRRVDEWHPSRGDAYRVEADAIRSETSKFNRINAPGYGEEVALRQKDTREERRLKCTVAAEALKIRKRVARQLKAKGHHEDHAVAEGMLAERAHKEASGAFPNGVDYPPLAWIEAKLAS
jgi:hypothetical protein